MRDKKDPNWPLLNTSHTSAIFHWLTLWTTLCEHMKITGSWWRPSEFRIPKATPLFYHEVLIHVVTFLKVLLAAAANSVLGIILAQVLPNSLRKVQAIWLHIIKFIKVLHFCVISPNYASGSQNPCLSLSIIQHRGLSHLKVPSRLQELSIYL